MRLYYIAPIPPLHVTDGTALANSTTLTDISTAPQIQLPAMFLEQGTGVEILASGQFSTTATPTLLVGAYYGAVAGVALAASAAITTGTATAWPWMYYYKGRVRAAGATGSIVGQGRLYLGTSLTVMSVNAAPATAAVRTVAIDTTTAKTITIGAQWNAASASNTITCNEIEVRITS